jgi:hypothetical protein
MELLIFSKNRPIQLKWCLLSVIKYNFRYNSILVIWSSDQTHNNAYLELIDSFDNKNDRIRFYKEKSFKKDLSFFVAVNFFRQIMFLTDDSIFINRPFFPSSRCTIGTREVCDHRLQNSRVRSDEDYLFSVDGRLYSSYLVKFLICLIPFKSPNSLESRVNWILAVLDRMGCKFKIIGQKQMCLVNLELNRVSTEATDNTSLDLDLSKLGVNLKTGIRFLGTPSRYHQKPKYYFDKLNNTFFVTLK